MRPIRTSELRLQNSIRQRTQIQYHLHVSPLPGRVQTLLDLQRANSLPRSGISEQRKIFFRFFFA